MKLASIEWRWSFYVADRIRNTECITMSFHKIRHRFFPFGPFKGRNRWKAQNLLIGRMLSSIRKIPDRTSLFTALVNIYWDVLYRSLHLPLYQNFFILQLFLINSIPLVPVKTIQITLYLWKIKGFERRQWWSRLKIYGWIYL